MDEFKAALIAEIEKRINLKIEETGKILSHKDYYTAGEYGDFKYGNGFVDGLREALRIIKNWHPEDEKNDRP